MTKLDITGKVCPFCLLSVNKELKRLPSGAGLVSYATMPLQPLRQFLNTAAIETSDAMSG
mgnify:CR=1 FL=1